MPKKANGKQAERSAESAFKAIAGLGFAKPADALGFFNSIQQQLYAA